ncbi:hydantoinase/oxoprolinase family protein [Methylobacillus sp.]|uniref:hydantoinase/oxoprolinase family protein n=1 Tax=Methylobacillus sp. TaxID=56818 RepID=UPI0012C6C337|nr:hydantoinase/oxoprolinase family protein [Methylobacillus sp.]MPS48857.1 S-layer protein [Methylobacillus sp.]
MTETTPSPQHYLGWDIGGANLKVALVRPDGIAVKVIQVPCPLWQGMDRLDAAIDLALAELGGPGGAKHSVTMTGELADIFPDRASGVWEIALRTHAMLGSELCFFAGASGFVPLAQVQQHANAIASANWLASAAFVATKLQQGLFIDIGSTTADFVLLHDGRPVNRGQTDAERMQHEELVYTGVARTSLMALASRIPFAGQWQNVAAEHFATTADVYRLTGELDPAEDMAATADGAGKSMDETCRRLARMVGRDADDADKTAWVHLAQAFRQQQLAILRDAVLCNLSRNVVRPGAPFIGAGAGVFLVRELAQQLGHEFLAASSLLKAESDQARNWAGVCLPAYAVANLGITANSQERAC